MDCTIILFVADWTLFCDFTRKHLPARLVIFVAQLGRKFRLFSLTVQRYEYFQCLPNNNRKIYIFIYINIYKYIDIFLGIGKASPRTATLHHCNADRKNNCKMSFISGNINPRWMCGG